RCTLAPSPTYSWERVRVRVIFDFFRVVRRSKSPSPRPSPTSTWARGNGHRVKLLAPEFVRFIAAVHRRLIVVRALESLGVCLLIASAAALPIVLLQMFRGQPALSIIAILAALALLAAV